VALRGLEELAPLPGTRREVAGIAGLFPESQRTVLLGPEATAAGLEARLADRAPLRALHLACHGHIDTVRPRLSGLVLSDGAILSLDDVYRLHVPADLVVLSACETARGRFLHGEGVIGLVRGFFYAGAPRVVVSNWKVRDDSTTELMVAFYRHMIEGGLTPAEALRAARLGMLRGGADSAHPSHWSGFVLWGLGD
jgi:CHAT domain-containing protein